MANDNIMTTCNPYFERSRWDRGLSKEDIERLEKSFEQIIKATPTYSIPKLNVTADSLKTAVTTLKSDEPEKTQEKWVWVDGYKGTDKNMQGHGSYQFEVGERYDMPLDAEIRDCHSGFHLSLNMKDVFKHYNIGKGNRFFKVRALVRERDLNEYGKKTGYSGFYTPRFRDKLASQSIKFIQELTVDEVFQDTEYANWSDEYKKLAMAGDLVEVKHMIMADELVELGYSKPFATYVVNKGRYETAKAVASQPDLSMDMKALMIMNW